MVINAAGVFHIHSGDQIASEIYAVRVFTFLLIVAGNTSCITGGIGKNETDQELVVKVATVVSIGLLVVGLAVALVKLFAERGKYTAKRLHLSKRSSLLLDAFRMGCEKYTFGKDIRV